MTAEARSAFQLVYEARLADLDRWIRETGDGFEAPLVVKGFPVADQSGKPVMVTIGKDPGKASDLLLRMAEHFIPKLNRTEHTGKDGAALVWRFEDE